MRVYSDNLQNQLIKEDLDFCKRYHNIFYCKIDPYDIKQFIKKYNSLRNKIILTENEYQCLQQQEYEFFNKYKKYFLIDNE